MENNIMKYLIFILLFVSLSFSQNNYRNDEINSKVKVYKKLLSNNYTPTENQFKYDVNYYQLELEINPNNRYINGKIKINTKVLNSIDKIEFNLTKGFILDSIFVNNKITSYNYTNDLLTVNLDRKYNHNESVSIDIYYQGYPGSSGFGSFGVSTINNKKMIWTLSEPFGARDWWPCKDHPYDKADSADIIITVPKDLIVASNGSLKKVIENNNKKTYYWHESYPIATYLISVTAYPYYTFSNYYKYSETDSMEIQYYTVYDKINPKYENFALVPNMIKIYSEIFGEYPFIKEKYGHAEFPWGGGMEHQTCTSLGNFGEYVIVHELAHQWWGDMITCKDFHHIWLNEGFATYSEALYAEKMYGKNKYFEEMNSTKYFGGGTIYVDDLSDTYRIFSGNLTYNKASWVLHMLRHVVGDSTFFQIIKEYYKSIYKYNSINTEEFQKICELIYKNSLDWFFHQWIYEEYFPKYKFNYSITKSGNNSTINLNILQTQTNYIFKMPIDINVSTSLGDTTIKIFDSLQTQTFKILVNGDVKKITLDKDEWILRTVEETPNTVNNIKELQNYQLLQNYPNPFNPSTEISFILPKKDYISLKIYDILGRELLTLYEGIKEYGLHKIEFNTKNYGIDFPSGIYFYILKTTSFYETKKMVIIK